MEGDGMHGEGMRPGFDEDDEVVWVIREEYARKARRKLVGTVVVLSSVGIGFFGMMIGAAMELVVFDGVWGFLAVIGGMFMVALGFSIFQLINWRCPRCQSQFKVLRNPRYCYNCGVRLRE